MPDRKPNVPRRDWTRTELLQALRLYTRFTFGRLHRQNPDIIALAARIGRTPNAVAMKACNFASLDPAITSTGRRGLTGASEADRQLWAEFMADSEAVAAEAERISDETAREPDVTAVDATTEPESPLLLPAGATETERLIRTRRVQSFFRAAVLTSYDCRCAVTGLADPRLLNASHIIPWSVNVSRASRPDQRPVPERAVRSSLRPRPDDGRRESAGDRLAAARTDRARRATDMLANRSTWTRADTPWPFRARPCRAGVSPDEGVRRKLKDSECRGRIERHTTAQMRHWRTHCCPA